MIKFAAYKKKYIVKAVYSYEDNGSAVGDYGLGAIIPSGAIVTNVYYNVKTAPTSSTSASKISINLVSNGDIVESTSLDDGSNTWSEGVHSSKVPFESLYLLLTENKELTVSISVEELLSGEIDIYLEYVI